jgi:hypothetical protein
MQTDHPPALVATRRHRSCMLSGITELHTRPGARVIDFATDGACSFLATAGSPRPITCCYVLDVLEHLLRTSHSRGIQTQWQLACVLVVYFLRTQSRAPYRTPPACANRAAYPDPPPVVPHPESIDARAAYSGRHSTIARLSPARIVSRHWGPPRACHRVPCCE